MGAVVAYGTDFRAAGFTFPDFATEGRVELDVFGLDPGAAVAGGTVEPVASRVLAELVVPLRLEGVGEEFVHVPERDVVGCAAAWRHVGGVGD